MYADMSAAFIAARGHRERLADELGLVRDCVADDGVHALVGEFVRQHVAVEVRGKLLVHPFVARDEGVARARDRGGSRALLSQKMAQKDPENKTPSTTANATRRSGRVRRLDPPERPLGLRATHGTWSTAWKRRSRSACSCTSG